MSSHDYKSFGEICEIVLTHTDTYLHVYDYETVSVESFELLPDAVTITCNGFLTVYNDGERLTVPCNRITTVSLDRKDVRAFKAVQELNHADAINVLINAVLNGEIGTNEDDDLFNVKPADIDKIIKAAR